MILPQSEKNKCVKMFLWEKNQGPQKFHNDSQAYNLKEIQCVKKNVTVGTEPRSS